LRAKDPIIQNTRVKGIRTLGEILASRATLLAPTVMKAKVKTLATRAAPRIA